MDCNEYDEAILQDYYLKKKTVKTIVEEHDIDVPNRIFEKFPLYKHEDLVCECCGSELVSKFASRDNSIAPLVLQRDIFEKEPVKVESRALSTYQYNRHYLHLQNHNKSYLTKEEYVINFPFCQSCGHEPSLRCQCEKCTDFKDRNYRLVVSEISEAIFPSIEPIRLDDYSTKDVFIALYVLTYQVKEFDTGFVPKEIGPISKESLIKSALLTEDTSEDGISSCIQMVSNTEFTFSPEKVSYVLNLAFEGNTQELLAELKNKALRIASSTDGQIELIEIWSELALEEALTVLKHYCSVFSLPYRPGETIISTVKRCLNRYGLAQTARYIYNSTKNAHTYALENEISGVRAFNSINGGINFWMDDERCRSWHAPPFSRGNEVLLEPSYTIVFTHSFLQNHGVDYFTLPINLKSFSSE